MAKKWRIKSSPKYARRGDRFICCLAKPSLLARARATVSSALILYHYASGEHCYRRESKCLEGATAGDELSTTGEM